MFTPAVAGTCVESSSPPPVTESGTGEVFSMSCRYPWPNRPGMHSLWPHSIAVTIWKQVIYMSSRVMRTVLTKSNSSSNRVRYARRLLARKSGSGLHQAHPVIPVLPTHCPHNVFTHLVQTQGVRPSVGDSSIA